jgi:glutamate/aspartate transport system permease protein
LYLRSAVEDRILDRLCTSNSSNMPLWFSCLLVLPESAARRGLWMKQLPMRRSDGAIGRPVHVGASPCSSAGIASAAGQVGCDRAWADDRAGLSLRAAADGISHHHAAATRSSQYHQEHGVAITIGLIELTGQARSMQEFSFQVFEAFTAATVMYLLINIVVVTGMRFLERSLAIPGYIAGK